MASRLITEGVKGYSRRVMLRTAREEAVGVSHKQEKQPSLLHPYSMKPMPCPQGKSNTEMLARALYGSSMAVQTQPVISNSLEQNNNSHQPKAFPQSYPQEVEPQPNLHSLKKMEEIQKHCSKPLSQPLAYSALFDHSWTRQPMKKAPKSTNQSFLEAMLIKVHAFWSPVTMPDQHTDFPLNWLVVPSVFFLSTLLYQSAHSFELFMLQEELKHYLQSFQAGISSFVSSATAAIVKVFTNFR